jgi:hypothetical protein
MSQQLQKPDWLHTQNRPATDGDLRQIEMMEVGIGVGYIRPDKPIGPAKACRNEFTLTFFCRLYQ